MMRVMSVYAGEDEADADAGRMGCWAFRRDSLASDLHVGRYKRWIRRGNEMGLELGSLFPIGPMDSPTVAGFKRWIACV